MAKFIDSEHMVKIPCAPVSIAMVVNFDQNYAHWMEGRTELYSAREAIPLRSLLVNN
jgi:hypothetical protein